MLGQTVTKSRWFNFFLEFSLNSLKRGNHSNVENIEDFRKVQRQDSSKIAQASLKAFS